MNPVNWFEIPVKDIDRAKKFYESVFGCTMELRELGPLTMCWFPMKEGPGSTGALVKAESYVPSHSGTLVYITVSEIDDTLAKVEKSGGKILNPKKSIGEYGFVGHFEDCEGNRVGLHQGK